MGRPTDDNKTKYIGIRINAETLDFLRQNGGNVSEIARNLLYDYVKQNNGSVKHKNSNVKQSADNSVKQNDTFVKQYESLRAKFDVLSTRVREEADKYFKNEQYTMLEIVPVGYHKTQSGCGSLPTELYNDIMSMVETYGMSYEDFMRIVADFLNDGYITDDGGSLKTVDSKLNTSGFIKKCDEFGIKDYQSMLDRLVKTMKTN